MTVLQLTPELISAPNSTAINDMHKPISVFRTSALQVCVENPYTLLKYQHKVLLFPYPESPSSPRFRCPDNTVRPKHTVYAD